LQSEETWMELHVLRRHGWSIAALAREFGLNWRTARRYATIDAAPRYRPRARPADLSRPLLELVAERLPYAAASLALLFLVVQSLWLADPVSFGRHVMGYLQPDGTPSSISGRT